HTPPPRFSPFPYTTLFRSPNQDQLVTIFPPIASAANPRSRTRPAHLAWRTRAFQRTIRTAPFSFGSQPQNLPQDWSAQMPPRIVDRKSTRLNSSHQIISYS